MSARFDVVIVGARIAGSALATHLARQGLRVAVVDRVAFPADTLSTHMIYPNSLARFDDLGVLDEVLATGAPALATRWFHGGSSFTAEHTPVRGHTRARCIRRITLDTILVDGARRAGAEVFERFAVQELIGAGTPEDPVRGVVGHHEGRTRTLEAPLVVGADGVTSTVAARLGLARERVLPTPTFMAYGYWEGLPPQGSQDFFFTPPTLATDFPADGGLHVVIVFGQVDGYRHVSGDAEAYVRLAGADPRLAERLARGRLVGKVVCTRRLDGFYRRATGPGWALVGDAGHFKHPAAVQGIADALRGAEVLAGLIGSGAGLAEFASWRDEASFETYALSRWAGEIPDERVIEPVIAAASASPTFARRLVDIWSRSSRPWEVFGHVPELAEAAAPLPEAALAGLTPLPDAVAIA